MYDAVARQLVDNLVMYTDSRHPDVVTFKTVAAARAVVDLLETHPDMPGDHYADHDDNGERICVVIRYKGDIKGACKDWAIAYIGKD